MPDFGVKLDIKVGNLGTRNVELAFEVTGVLWD